MSRCILTSCKSIALFFSNAWPRDVFPPTGTNPLMPKAFRAWATALPNAAIFLPFLLLFARSEAFLLTTLPSLFLVKSDFFKPPLVRSLPPRNTLAFAPLPLATFDTLMAFFLFILFIAFFILFMDFLLFILFIDFAMVFWGVLFL